MEGGGADQPMPHSRVLLGVDAARVPQVLLQPQRPQIAPPPRSALLDRLATFLPAMEASNARMQQNDPVVLQEDEFAAADGEEAVAGEVEMDLYCGLMAAPAADEGDGQLDLRLPGQPPRRGGGSEQLRAGITEL